MSNFFISIGFLITAIQIFASKKIARAYDSTDYSLMGDFYLLSGVAALVGAILFFGLDIGLLNLKISRKNLKTNGVIAVAKLLKSAKMSFGAQIVVSH